MKTGQRRVLVLTLHTDEPQLERCIDSIRSQVEVAVNHQVISGLGNVEAHRELYSTIESRASEFDLFVKVDADMVLAGRRVLAEINQMFERDPGLDHVQFAIDDFYTCLPIMGLHAFSSRVSWPNLDEQLFVDPAPVAAGRRVLLWEPPTPIALHSPDPTPVQAFRFGVHRASKAFQRDRSRFRGSQAREQWKTLTSTWDAFVRHGDSGRGLAIYGADLVWRDALDLDAGGYQSEDIDVAFRLAPKHPVELREALQDRWRPGLGRSVRHVRSLGLRRATRLLAATVRQELESVPRAQP